MPSVESALTSDTPGPSPEEMAAMRRERLVFAMADFFHSNRVAFARAAGVPNAELNGWLQGEVPISDRKARKLERNAGLPRGYMDGSLWVVQVPPTPSAPSAPPGPSIDEAKSEIDEAKSEEIRKARLRALIDQRFDGKLKVFAAASQVNISDISRLLSGARRFDARRARVIEINAHLNEGYLDGVDPDDALESARLERLTMLSEISLLQKRRAAAMSEIAKADERVAFLQSEVERLERLDPPQSAPPLRRPTLRRAATAGRPFIVVPPEG